MPVIDIDSHFDPTLDWLDDSFFSTAKVASLGENVVGCIARMGYTIAPSANVIKQEAKND
jgi:hypothetical protein